MRLDTPALAQITISGNKNVSTSSRRRDDRAYQDHDREDGKTTVTETVKVTRKTYAQVWPAYNKAQTEEKRLFQYLLRQLCEGVGEPAQMNGRPRLPIEDMLFSMAFKVYSTVSCRRFMTDLKEAHGKGYMSKLPCYNSVFNYFEDEMLTDHLLMLIEESSLPLASIESDFAVDSTGISTNRFVQWMHAKYSEPHLIDKKNWIKLHICCGVKTNVVTAVSITDRRAGDSPQFKPLVEATRRNFVMDEVSADKAYLSADNLSVVVDAQAMPYIPFSPTASRMRSDIARYGNGCITISATTKTASCSTTTSAAMWKRPFT
jgi:hypothetical protein